MSKFIFIDEEETGREMLINSSEIKDIYTEYADPANTEEGAYLILRAKDGSEYKEYFFSISSADNYFEKLKAKLE
jgi:hypothetical protein